MNPVRPSTSKTSPGRGRSFCGFAVSAAQTQISGRVTTKANSAVNARKLLLEVFPPAFAAVPRDFFLSINVLIMVSLYFFNILFIPLPGASPIRKSLSALPYP
jgi:hypothetical protein